ncbi:type 4 prepilin peptidase 1 [Cyanobacterium stanieri PCC 7202]|uniref:Prepilin leader peptidase/N-methyltransferase n=1 Tax=Cyanobacterium stanieri (strain ATCC 29140 / PCC 7202) TaxID=292563 RepID=K9YMY1_CYASC|nr:type 4 prepilin peptidase 1 [Cyanobacterium stanieri PCC 7202]
MPIAPYLVNLIVFVLGACIGSFLNVVIYRLPAKISLIHPPSRCPHCLHPLGVTENVPVLGWLWLGGKCRWCKTPISFRYPLIEAFTGLLFVLVFLQFGISWQTLGYFIFVSWLIVLALIDFDTLTLPNVLTQTGLVVGLCFQTALGLMNGGVAEASLSLFVAILSAVVGIWLFDAILIIGTFAFGKPAMGGGDPKLVAMIGVWLGWQNVLITGFLACLVGALVGISAIALGSLKKGQPMPFGPFLVVGAMIALFYGDTLLSAYLNYMFY